MALLVRTLSEKPKVVTSWQFQAPSSIQCFTWAFCKILHVRFIDMWLSFYQFFPPLMWIPYACMQWMDGGTNLELPRHSSGFCSAFPLGSPQVCTLTALYFSVMVCVFRDLRHELWFVQCSSPGSSIFARLIFCFVLYSVLVLWSAFFPALTCCSFDSHIVGWSLLLRFKQ